MIVRPLILLSVIISLALALKFCRADGNGGPTRLATGEFTKRPPLTPAVSPVITSTELADLLARPLFEPGRRSAQTTSESVGVVAPRLTGVLVSNFSKTALFATANGGKNISVVEGDYIGERLIKSIAANSVVLLGPEGPVLLHPAFDSLRRRATHIMDIPSDILVQVPRHAVSPPAITATPDG